MKHHKYTRPNVAAYHAWLESLDNPALYETASRFRPWEWYQMQGRDIFVQVVDYDPSGQLIDVRREDGAVLTVVPHQIDLYAVDIKDLPARRDFATPVAKHTQPN